MMNEHTDKELHTQVYNPKWCGKLRQSATLIRYGLIPAPVGLSHTGAGRQKYHEGNSRVFMANNYPG